MSSILGGGSGGGGTPAAGANLVFWVSTTGSDSNPGTFAAPFATHQHAALVAESFDYQSSFFPTINTVDGTYNLTNAITLGPIPGIGAFFGVFNGNTTTPTNVVLSNNSGDVLSVNNSGARWFVKGFTLKPNDQANCLVAFETCVVQVVGNMAFDCNNFSFGPNILGALNYSLITCSGVTLQILCAGVFQFETAITNSVVDVHSCTITSSAGLAIGNAWIDEQQFSFIIYRGITYANSGSVTGQSVLAITGSLLVTQNGLLSDIPGSTPVFDPTCAIHGFGNSATSLFIQTFSDNITEGGYVVFEESGSSLLVLGSTLNGVGGRFVLTDTINTKTSSYQFALGDDGQRTEANSAGAITFTVPTHATTAFPINAQLKATNIGAGNLTIAAAVGVTGNNFGTLTQWQSAIIYQRATDVWVQTSV